MTHTIIRDGERKEFDDKERFKDTCDLLDERGVDYETESDSRADGGKVETHTVAEPVESEPMDVDQFHQDPIGYLSSINNEFVNTIKGTPAISKRGFRFMQTELGVSTTAEVVATFDDPKGVVVHARAEMPDGRFAEAHGEGYLTESGVSDNEFVRYADTRAKNRAISDLTSSGALAESELTK